MSQVSRASVVIIGSGVSGLTCAKSLLSLHSHLDVIVVDKGRRAGGRMATQRHGQAVFDKGAQFFTIRSDEFRQQVQQWDQIKVWSHGFFRHRYDDDVVGVGVGVGGQDDGHARYVCVEGMNHIVSTSLRNQISCEVKQNTKVLSVRTKQRNDDDNNNDDDGGCFIVTLDDGLVIECRVVVMSCPVPQSLSLLNDETLLTHHTDHQEATKVWMDLKKIKYHKCVSAQIVSSGGKIPEPGGWQIPCKDVRWVCDNYRKGISSVPCFTVHMDNVFSEKNYELDETNLKEEVMKSVTPLLKREDIKEIHIHKWRYAEPIVPYHERCAKMEVGAGRGLLLFCGDAFKEAKVEGATRSGIHAANELSKWLISHPTKTSSTKN